MIQFYPSVSETIEIRQRMREIYIFITFVRKPWRDILTYYLSLNTYYLLLITYYLLLITYYLLLTTYHLLLILITYHIIYHPYNDGKLHCTFPVIAVAAAAAAVVVVVVVVVYM